MTPNPYAPPKTPEPPSTLPPPEFRGPWSVWTVFQLTFAALRARGSLLLFGALLITTPGIVHALVLSERLKARGAAPLLVVATQVGIRLLAAYLEAGYVGQWLAVARSKPVPSLFVSPVRALPLLIIEVVKMTTVDLPDLLKAGTGVQLGEAGTVIAEMLSLLTETTVFAFGRALAVELGQGGLSALSDGLALLQRAPGRLISLAAMNIGFYVVGMVSTGFGLALISSGPVGAVLGTLLILGGLVPVAAISEGAPIVAYLFARHSTAMNEQI